MPGMDGYEVCRRLKLRPGDARHPGDLRHEPERRGGGNARTCLGAVDFIAKPVNLRVTRARILTRINSSATRPARANEPRGCADGHRESSQLRRDADARMAAKRAQHRRRSRCDGGRGLLQAVQRSLRTRCRRCVPEAGRRRSRLPRYAGRATSPARYGGEEFAALLADTPLEAHCGSRKSSAPAWTARHTARGVCRPGA